ncbi:MAG TPA: hypothetical protein PKZ53_25660, partial [Acidobacteriota bacterium]|nr:hypothetical protein [Acidobacteriota bacterium]
LADWKLTEETLHFYKNPKFGQRIMQLALPLYSAVDDMQEDDLSPEERAYHDLGLHLERQLAERGMIPTVAGRLVESMLTQGKLDAIEKSISFFDRHYRTRKLINPGGFLYTLIVNDLSGREREEPAPAPSSAKSNKFPESPALEEITDPEHLQLLELGYIDYLERTGEELLVRMRKTELKQRIDQEREKLLASDKRRIYERWSAEVLSDHLRRLVGRSLAAQQAESFASWCAQQGVILSTEGADE